MRGFWGFRRAAWLIEAALDCNDRLSCVPSMDNPFKPTWCMVYPTLPMQVKKDVTLSELHAQLEREPGLERSVSNIRDLRLKAPGASLHFSKIASNEALQLAIGRARGKLLLYAWPYEAPPPKRPGPRSAAAKAPRPGSAYDTLAGRGSERGGMEEASDPAVHLPGWPTDPDDQVCSALCVEGFWEQEYPWLVLVCMRPTNSCYR